MNTELSILGTGLLCTDIIEFENKKIMMNGGTCANVLSILSQMDWISTIIKPKYNDYMDEIIESNLNLFNVKIINSKITNTSSPRIIEELINNSHKFYIKCPLCGRKTLSTRYLSNKNVIDLNLNYNEYDAFFYDRISPGIRLIVSEMHENNKTTFYEPNTSRNLTTLINDCLNTTIVKFSRSQISYNIAEEIRINAYKHKTKIIILTDSDNGLMFTYRKEKDMSEWIKIDSFNSDEIRDTSGAGDWLTAGFIYKFFEKKDLNKDQIEENTIIEALNFGKTIAMISCKAIGAQGLFYSKRLSDELSKLSGISINMYNKLSLKTIGNIKEKCERCLIEF